MSVKQDNSRRKSISDRYNRPNRCPRWGTDTGIEGKENTRLVYLNELFNYRRLTHNGFNFFLTVFAGNYPRFVRWSVKGYERWRMRFNIFASGIFTEWHPNTVLHHGELHVYYDLIPGRDRPWCLDFTFYYDDRPIESQVLSNKYDIMDSAWKDSLCGRDQVLKYLLFLPIHSKEFVNPKESLNHFLECQQDMLARLINYRDSNEYYGNGGYAESGCDRRAVRDNTNAISPKMCVDSEGWITSSKNRRRRNYNKKMLN